mgnify:CR=1 FL=1
MTKTKEPTRYAGSIAAMLTERKIDAESLASHTGITLHRADSILRNNAPPPHPAIVDLRPLATVLGLSYGTLCGMADNDRAKWWGVPVGHR